MVGSPEQPIEWRRFDALPPRVRQAVREMALPARLSSDLVDLARRDEAAALRKVADMDKRGTRALALAFYGSEHPQAGGRPCAK